MNGLTEEEKEILRKAEEIKRRMEEDIDMVPDDFGEPVKKKKASYFSNSKTTEIMAVTENTFEDDLSETKIFKSAIKSTSEQEKIKIDNENKINQNLSEQYLEFEEDINLDQENFVGYEEVASEDVVDRGLIDKEVIDKKPVSKEVIREHKEYQRENVIQKRDEVQQEDKTILKGEKKKTKKKLSAKRSKKRKKSKIRRIGNVIWKCIFILLLLLVLLYVAVRCMVSKTNYHPYKTEYVRSEDVVSKKGVKNYLVIGTDERIENDTSRSDTMIILSINEKTNKIILTSILRDSYVDIPGYGQDRINAAYQFGGAALSIQTVEENFKVAIDGYIKVDFFSFVDIVDAVGGVYIDVDEGELTYVNGYLNEINSLLGVNVGDGYLTTAGYQLLNGKQALSYSRIRYIGTDFQRTERQREVIEAVLAQVKSSKLTEIYAVVNEVLPQIDTSLDEHTMSMIMMKAILYLGYDIEQNRIPMDGTWNYAVISGKDVINLDCDANSQRILEIIYGE